MRAAETTFRSHLRGRLYVPAVRLEVHVIPGVVLSGITASLVDQDALADIELITGAWPFDQGQRTFPILVVTAGAILPKCRSRRLRELNPVILGEELYGLDFLDANPRYTSILGRQLGRAGAA